jgi:hypothetical protein
MDSIKEQKKGKRFDAENVTSVYCNAAGVTMSLHDIKIFLAEISPKEVSLEKIQEKPKETESVAFPKICIVVSPEFARSLRDVLSSTIGKYESQFGQLRANPVPLTTEKPIK